MNALIDADIVAFRCAAASENENEDIAVYRTHDLMRRILHDTCATEYEAFLSGQNNFRKEVDPLYKAHRALQPRPIYYEQCREALVTEWKARVADGVEADDEIGLAATAYFEQAVPFVIASIDKDLKQLPGKHFNFVTQEFAFVSPLDAIKTFYSQLLIGDRADNVIGVQGIGKVKSARLIDPLHEEIDMFTCVRALYHDDTRFYRNSQLLWILKKSLNPEEVLSHFHSLQKPDEEVTSTSLPSSPETNDPGLEFTVQ